MSNKTKNNESKKGIKNEKRETFFLSILFWK